MPAKCPECGSRELYSRANVPAGAMRGPNLLPELGSFLFPARVRVVGCADCGLVRFYAEDDERAKMKRATLWKPEN